MFKLTIGGRDEAYPMTSESTATVPPTPVPEEPASFRRFFQILLSFFCWFLVIRTMAVEPFGVLTGSMAPAFHGIHRQSPCSRCGYPVRVGEPGPNARAVRFTNCRCQNCGEEMDLSKAQLIVGDRLMVDKTAFQYRLPRRWEAAVFRCPADMTKPYVKRLVGLPGEVISLNDGDLYINGEIARKTLDQIRELKLPVFAMDYAPAEAGWSNRWEEEPLADPKLPMIARPSGKKIDKALLVENTLILDGEAKSEGVGLTYKNLNLDTNKEEAIGDFLSYNGGPNGSRDAFGKRTFDTEPVRDFLVQFELEVVSGSGRFACRLSDGGDTVLADFPVNQGGQPVQIAQDGGNISPGQVVPMLPNHRYFIEFAFVDRRISLAVDGREIIVPVDLPIRRGRSPIARPLQLGCRGASVKVKHLKLFRDVHYQNVGKAGTNWKLGADEYFFLGDNTANSDDSRTWKIAGQPAPGVPIANFVGKPFLIHQPMRAATYTLNGKDRAIQTLDWSRIRWVR